MSLSTRILLGLVLGVATGLFFGEHVAFLGVAGDGFVMLLQMTVLPYVTVSLVHGLGSVSQQIGEYVLERHTKPDSGCATGGRHRHHRPSLEG